MKEKEYKMPTLKIIFFTENFVRTSPENDAEIDGDKAYGDDGWSGQ